MATVSIMLRASATYYRVSLCVRHLSKNTSISTPYTALPSEVDAHGHLRPTAHCAAEIDADLLAARNTLRALSHSLHLYSIGALADAIRKSLARSRGLATTEEDFIFYARALAERKRKTQPTTAAGYTFIINSIVAFNGSALPFSRLTRRWLCSYEGWLRGRGVAQSTISTYMRRVRSIHRQARVELNDEELGHIVVPFDPFTSYRIPPEITEIERHIDLSHIRTLRDSEPMTQREALGRDVFFLSLYLMGMNAIDLMTCPPPIDGRIRYRRSKVEAKRGNAATMSVRIIAEAQPIVQRYVGTNSAFDFAQRYVCVGDFRAAVNKGLSSICRRLNIPVITFYYARHAFAEIAHQHLGVPLDDVARCLNHSSQTRSITFRYAGRDYARIDDIQRQVADFVAAL